MQLHKLVLMVLVTLEHLSGVKGTKVCVMSSWNLEFNFGHGIFCLFL